MAATAVRTSRAGTRPVWGDPRRLNPCPDKHQRGHRNCVVCAAFHSNPSPASRHANPCPNKYQRGHRNCVVCAAHH